MKTLLRTLLYLALIVWLGAEIFFPVVAAITFTTLRPDAHNAGTIVGQLLRILHGMGMVSGMVALALLAPMILVVLMMALTGFSQFAIIPAMERDRLTAGGAIDDADATDPSRIDFNKLHIRSERVEETILLLGVATVALVALAETKRP